MVITRTRLVLLAVMAAAATTAGLVACASSAEPEGPVRVGIGPVGELVPTNLNDPDSAQVLSAVFAPLVDLDPQGRPYEVAAASVVPDQANRVWTVTLREGMSFHNGEPVTATSFVNAWNYGAYQPNQQRANHLFARIEGYAALNPPPGTAPATPRLAGLEVVDERVFTVTLTEPFAHFREMLSAPAFYPLPAAAFSSPGVLREDFKQAPVGNGPYRIVEPVTPGDPIRLRAHPAHPGPAPAADEVVLVPYQNPATAYADLLAGELDVVSEIPTDRLDTVDADLEGRYLRHPSPVFQFLAIPTYQAELADPRVRQAISMAIDRDQVSAAGVGGQLPARSFVPPLVPGARTDTCGAACELNPDAARRLYAEAHGPDRLTITYNADGDHKAWVAAICDQLTAHLGVRCAAEPKPSLPDLLARVHYDRAEVGLLRLGWAMEYPSMESYLAPVYSTTGAGNYSGYHNAEFDALLAAAAAADSPEEAIARYQEAEDLLAQDLPVIPVRFGQRTVGYSPRLAQVPLTRWGHIDLAALQPR